MLSCDLTGRRALVTGASRGIGRTLAVSLARAGATVAVHARERDNLNGVLQDIAAVGRDAVAVAGDFSDFQAALQVGRQAETFVGGIDVLVNNAGTADRASLLESRPQSWMDVFGVNVVACLAVAQSVAPGMIDRGWGRIINLGSPYARLPSPGLGAYCASKAAVEMLTKSMALEWAGTGVTANAIAPIQVLTDLTRPSYDDEKRRCLVSGQIPLGRWATAEDLVGAVLYLSSDASSMVTGQTIAIDGGRSLL